MNNHCLFCTQQSLAICCLDCRERDRSTLFEFLLKLFGQVFNIDNYYDQIKVTCQQIETVSPLSIRSRLRLIVHLVGMAAKADSIHTHQSF